MDQITHWNDAAQEANRVAHTTLDAREAGARGPAGSSRAFAIVHLAMHDAYFTIRPSQDHGTYLTTPPALPATEPRASARAAIAAAAHATLSALYPAQKAYFDAHHAAAGLSGPGMREGHVHGLKIAAAILAARKDDPTTGDDGYASSVMRGAHRPDPESPTQGYHAPLYGARSRCFAVKQRHQLDDPPKLGSAVHLAALAEVRAKGIAPELMGTLPAGAVPRTPAETAIGLFWAYDGAKELGTPPRLYNQIIRKIAEANDNTLAQNARLFALVNAAMGDAGILAWEQKYRHDLWRPVLGIRENDPSMGPTGVGNDAFDSECDPDWLPLGAPKTNEPGKKNGTPPFPAYPSGHATFGAAAFQIVRHFYGVTEDGPDELAGDISFVSDELNGISTDNKGNVRARHARRFADGLWQMIEENGTSRVYLGVHWVYDAFVRDPTTGEMDLSQNIGGVPLGLAIANDLATNGLEQANGAGPSA